MHTECGIVYWVQICCLLSSGEKFHIRKEWKGIISNRIIVARCVGGCFWNEAYLCMQSVLYVLFFVNWSTLCYRFIDAVTWTSRNYCCKLSLLFLLFLNLSPHLFNYFHYLPNFYYFFPCICHSWSYFRTTHAWILDSLFTIHCL